MNKQEWNEGLNHIDADLVESYVEEKEKRRQRKKTIPLWVRVVAVAACLAIVIGVWNAPNSSGKRIAIGDFQMSWSVPQYYGYESTANIFSGSSAEEVDAGISVTARFVEALPDTFTFYDDWSQTEFYLLRMEVITVLEGNKVPDEFLFIMPKEYMTDYSLYDKLIFDDIAQYGYEYSLLYNKTQDRPQQIDTVLFGSVTTGFGYLARLIEAFDTEGRFDMRLWESTEEWKKRTSRTVEYYGTAYYEAYTLQAAEEIARDIGGGYKDLYVHSLANVRGEAAAALAYIKNLENGTYITAIDGFMLYSKPEVQLHFQRFIGGMATNETGRIYADQVKWSTAKFTKEDEQALPNLPAALAAVAAATEAGEIKPSHIQGLSNEARSSYGVFGWYAKTPKGVIGVVRVTWRYTDESLGHYTLDLYYDDAYYIIEYGGEECVAIDRDDLLEMFGEYETTHIFTGEYDRYGKVQDEIIS